MNTGENKKTVDIILPPKLNEASESALSLCELFIGRVLSSSMNPVMLSVDTPNAVVESNSPGLKDALTLILKSKNTEPFYRQFVDLLHPNEISEELGEIRCVIGAKKLVLGVTENDGYPDFSWSVTVR
ncbi:MAG: hypothetical protein OEY38_00175 [Gammaproteobacteria bacterium]|nr:hypothetical protein [Gammaproteobacteria bacterium]